MVCCLFMAVTVAAAALLGMAEAGAMQTKAAVDSDTRCTQELADRNIVCEYQEGPMFLDNECQCVNYGTIKIDSECEGKCRRNELLLVEEQKCRCIRKVFGQEYDTDQSCEEKHQHEDRGQIVYHTWRAVGGICHKFYCDR